MVPAVVAADGSALRDRLTSGPLTPDVLEAVLEAEASGASLGALEAALAARLGDEARAQALLRLLFGELLRIYRYEGGPQAVFVVAGPAAPASSAGSAPGVVQAAAEPTVAHGPRGVPHPAAVDTVPVPKKQRPSVQPLGP